MRLATVAALALVASPVLAQVPGAPDRGRIAGGTYAVDPDHTQVTWQVNHMGFSLLQGQFGASEGSLTINPASPASAKVDVTFAADKLSTTSSAFATHLKSKELFDVATYPTIRFVSTKVTATGNRAVIFGNLTIKNITKPVTLEANFIGAGINPMNKKANVGFRATTSVSRTDFGLGLAAPMVSDKVDLVINAAFVAP